MLFKKIFYRCLLIFGINLVVVNMQYAQDGTVVSPELKAMYQEADAAMASKQYDKAINIYFQAIRLQPNNIVLRRDLAYAYYLSGRHQEGIQTLDEVIESGNADEQSYQLLSALENAAGNKRRSSKVIDDGLRKFPNSGLLLYSKGNIELGSGKNNKKALKYYSDGIASDPYYANNYLAAGRALLDSDEPVWALIYAEIFINLEPESSRSIEGKKLLLDAYRKMYSSQSAGSLPAYNKVNRNQKTSFKDAVKAIYSNNYLTVANEMNVENMTMLKVRFLLDWTSNYSLKDHSMFAFYDELIKNGHFEAYNQFLLGAITDSATFSAWVQRNGSAMKGLSSYLASHPYRPAPSDPQYK